MSAALSAWSEAWGLAPRAMEGGALAAAACAALGPILRWRRLVWAGFAVPQAATVGHAAALGLPTLWAALGLSGAPPPLLLDVGVSVLGCAAVAVLWLVPVGRTPNRADESAAAVGFLLASTLSVLLVAHGPHGAEEVRALAAGRSLLFLSSDDLAWLWRGSPLLVLAGLALAPPLAAVAFDRDHQVAAGRRVALGEAGFALAFLLLVAQVVPRAGAPFLFAYLLLPAAAAERAASRPIAIVVTSTALGVAGSLAGGTAAVAYDLPFATASVAGALLVGGAALGLGLATKGLARRR